MEQVGEDARQVSALLRDFNNLISLLATILSDTCLQWLELFLAEFIKANAETECVYAVNLDVKILS
ncbi:MAG: hypothetical protein C0421_00810 [Hyphomonas sp.]|nr:hypothetical protein [Hyphomonas sp.]